MYLPPFVPSLGVIVSTWLWHLGSLLPQRHDSCQRGTVKGLGDEPGFLLVEYILWIRDE